MSTNKTDFRFKILYAIGIIFVVAGHCYDPINILTRWFPYYSFHLALFIFASAYFYKPENEHNVSKYIKKKIKTLLVPLYLYNIFYALFVHFTHTLGFTIGKDISFYSVVFEPWIGGHQFMYNMGGWFIAPLFTIEIVNILFRVICNKISLNKWKYHEILYYILFTCVGLVGIHLAITQHNSYFILLYRCAYFLPFWGLGRLYKTFLEAYDKKVPSSIYFAVIFFIQILISYHIGRVPEYTPSWLNNFTDGIFIPIIVGYTGIAFWFKISQILTPIIGHNKYINTIANNAYSIMINQFLGFFIIKLCFAIIYSNSFNFNAFKTNIFWYFYPENCKHIGLLYLLGGIIIPIYIQKLVDYAKTRLVPKSSLAQIPAEYS